MQSTVTVCSLLDSLLQVLYLMCCNGEAAEQQGIIPFSQKKTLKTSD